MLPADTDYDMSEPLSFNVQLSNQWKTVKAANTETSVPIIKIQVMELKTSSSALKNNQNSP